MHKNCPVKGCEYEVAPPTYEKCFGHASRERADNRLGRTLPFHFCSYGSCTVDYCPNNTTGPR